MNMRRGLRRIFHLRYRLKRPNTKYSRWPTVSNEFSFDVSALHPSFLTDRTYDVITKSSTLILVRGANPMKVYRR